MNCFISNFVSKEENNGLIPGIALLLGSVILFIYPLKGKYLEEIQYKVMKLHEEKAAALEN